MLTREWYPGVGYVTEDANFAQYQSPFASSTGWWNFMQQPRYKEVLSSPDLTTAMGAFGQSGYATDPAYGSKLSRLAPRTPEQQAFFDARRGELEQIAVPTQLPDLGARVSALETGWGKSAPGNNFYGIKAPQPMRVAQAGRPDIQQGPFPGGSMGAQSPQQMPPGGQPPSDVARGKLADKMTVNGVPVDHYVINGDAFLAAAQKSQDEKLKAFADALWKAEDADLYVDSKGGYPLAFGGSYSGSYEPLQFQGVFDVQIELTGINQDTSIKLPASCNKPIIQ